MPGYHLFLVVSICRAIDLGEPLDHLNGVPVAILSLQHHMIFIEGDHIHLKTHIINLLMVATLLIKWLQEAILVLAGSRGLITFRDLHIVEVIITTAGMEVSLPCI